MKCFDFQHGDKNTTCFPKYVKHDSKESGYRGNKSVFMSLLNFKSFSRSFVKSTTQSPRKVRKSS